MISKIKDFLNRYPIQFYLLFSILLVITLLRDWSFPEILMAFSYLMVSGLVILPCFTLSFNVVDKFKENKVLSIGFGLFLFLVISRAVIVSSILNSTSLIIYLIFGWVYSLIYIFNNRIRLRNEIIKFKKQQRQFNIWDLILFSGVIILGVNSIITTHSTIFTPPLTFDLSLIHLTLPKFFIANGGIFNPWWLRGVFIPQAAHSAYSFGMVGMDSIGLWGDIFPPLFNFWLLVCTLLSFRYFSSEKHILLLGYSLFMGVPVLRWSSSTSYIDLMNSFFVLSGIILIVDYYKRPSRIKMMYLGAFMALGFSVKHFFAIFIIMPLLLAVIFKVKNNKNEIKGFILDIVFAIIPALSILILFFYYNYLMSGDPLFPFLTNQSSEIYNKFFWGKDSLLSFTYAINNFKTDIGFFTPFKLIYQLGFDKGAYLDTPGFRVGPIWTVLFLSNLIIFIYLLLKKKERTFTLILLNFASISSVYLWLLFSPVQRYLLPQIVVMVSLYVYHTTFFKKRRMFFIPLVLCFIKPVAFEKFTKPTFTVEERSTFLKNNLAYYPSIKYLNEASDVTVVYSFFTEGSWLYLDKPFVGDWFGHSHYGHIFSGTKESLRKFFSEREVSHIFTNEQGYMKLMNEDFPYRDCLIEEFSADFNGKSYIYKIITSKPECYNSKTSLLPEMSKYLEVVKKIKNYKGYL